MRKQGKVRLAILFRLDFDTYFHVRGSISGWMFLIHSYFKISPLLLCTVGLYLVEMTSLSLLRGGQGRALVGLSTAPPCGFSVPFLILNS